MKSDFEHFSDVKVVTTSELVNDVLVCLSVSVLVFVLVSVSVIVELVGDIVVEVTVKVESPCEAFSGACMQADCAVAGAKRM